MFVTPEYNRSTSGVLKNAIDFLYAEWANKAAGFVSYGVDGGARAVEHLRQVLGRAPGRRRAAQVALSLFTGLRDVHRLQAGGAPEEAVTAMLDQVVSWGTALAPLRAAA